MSADPSDRDLSTAMADRAGVPPVGGVVELTIPVQSDLLVLARLTASTVASRSSFDIEEIDDLRLAVDELCLSVLQGRRSGRLHLRVDGRADQIEVWCRYEGPEQPATRTDDEDTDQLSGRILDALVDEHGTTALDGLPAGWLCKRRARRDA